MPTLAEFDNAFARGTRSVPGLKRLGDGRMMLLESGLPRRVVGANAVVYRYQLDTGGSIAIRCFLADDVSPGTRMVYQQAANPAHFRRLRSTESSPLVQRIAWIDDAVLLPAEGFRTRGESVVAMEWIAGPTVFQAADVATRRGQGDLLHSVAEQWLTAMSALREVGFAHGALSPTNALIDRDRGILLVDYDTAWWPGLPDTKKSFSPSGYRHPRGITSAPERRDDFAALVHYVSLRALAAYPQLRSDYGDAVGIVDPALLFDQRDLERPEKSAVFQDLQTVEDREIRALAGMLREAAVASPDDTPFVADARAAASRLSVVVPDLPPTPAPATSRNGRQEVTKVPAMLPVIDAGDAEKLEQLERAIDTGDVDAIMQTWPDVATSPAFSKFAIEVNALIEEACDRALEQAVQDGNRDEIRRQIANARRFGVPVPPSSLRASRPNANEQTHRMARARAVDSHDIERLAGMAAIAEFSRTNAQGANSTFEMESLSFQLVMLRDAIVSDDDRRVLMCSTAELLAQTELLTPEIRDRVALARKRINWKELVRRSLRERDHDRLVELTANPPEGAMESLTVGEIRRIDRAITQRRAGLRLQEAMASGSDRAMIDAMNEIEASGGLLPPELEWSSLRALADKLSLISAVRRAARANPPDYVRLGRLLPSVRTMFGEETPYLGAGLDFETLEFEVRKASHRKRLIDAIERGDDVAVAHAASPDPYDVVATLPAEQRRRVEDLLERLRKIDPLKER